MDTDSFGTSVRPEGVGVIDRFLLHRRLPWLLAGLAILLTLPSLWAGRLADDFHHQLRLTRSEEFHALYPELPANRFGLFDFADGNPDHTRTMMEIGYCPWWAHPSIRSVFFRPLTVLTHWIDYTLWPEHPSLMHVQSMLWFAANVFVVTLLFRNLLGRTRAAGLAALLYAIDDARAIPAAWLANRNTLIATLFVVLTLIAHDRWRRGGRRWSAVLGPVLLAVSLLAKESGVAACAYLFAYALFLDKGRLRGRLVSLLPYAAVIVVWRITWEWLGCGMEGLGVYVDPVRDPVTFAWTVVGRGPILLLGQWFLPPSDLAAGGPIALYTGWYSACAAVLLCVIGVGVASRVPRDPVTRYCGVGMFLSLLPACAGFPSDRMLSIVGIGAFGLLARFLVGVFGGAGETAGAVRSRARSRFVHWLGVAMIVVHLGWAPLFLLIRSYMPLGPRSILDELYLTLPENADVEHKTVVVVTAPNPLTVGFLVELRVLAGLPPPAHTRVLAPCTTGPVVVRRIDAYTLEATPTHGYLAQPFDRLPRSERYPFAVGDRVELSDMVAEIVSLNDDQRPETVSFRFSVPLEHSSLDFWYWDGGRFALFVPPPVGESVILPTWMP